MEKFLTSIASNKNPFSVLSDLANVNTSLKYRASPVTTKPVLKSTRKVDDSACTADGTNDKR